MNQITVLIADDHRLIRHAIKNMLSDVEDILLEGEAENGEELLAMMKKSEPDIVLMDVNMPKLDGIEATRIIKATYPDCNVIVLTMHEDADNVYKCMKEGAISYLPKNVEKEELLLAIRKAYKDEKYLPAGINELYVEGTMQARKASKEGLKLSKREKEIVQLLVTGQSTKQMADKLFLSTRTVESHRLRLLKKFSAQNGTELLKILKEKKMI